MSKKPVLFLTFNRPEPTKKVFEAIRKYRPDKLFIASDGARDYKSGEKEIVEQVRRICTDVDWECQVFTLFRDTNLGCRKAVSEAISWFFNQVDEGIILEDDCLPSPSFFTFCEVMLDRYRDTPQIMHIGGTNFQFGKVRSDGDYYYSTITHIWGWATWKRAWELYDGDFSGLTDFYASKKLAKIYPKHFYLRWYWKKSFDTVKKTMTTWDYQWSFTLLNNNGLAVIPNKNLVVNIGFSDGATHGSFIPKIILQLKLVGMDSFKSPTRMAPNIEADYYTIVTVFEFSFFKRIRNFIIKFFLKYGRRYL